MEIESDIDYKDIELLEKILSSRPLTSITNISRLLNKSKVSVSRRLKRLREKGFKFTVDIDYWAIGLKLNIAILQGYRSTSNINTRFLHSIVRLIPNSTLISYYKPIESDGDLFQEDYSVYEDQISADEVYGSKPDFKKYVDPIESKIKLDENSIIDEIMQVISNTSNSIMSEILYIEKMRKRGKAKISEMDLKIVSILEEHGIVSPNTIAEKLGLKKSRVIKRLSIISRYIQSISLSETPWSKNLPLIVVTSIKTRKPEHAKSIVSVLSKHPLHKRTYLSALTGEFISIFYADSMVAETLAKIFNTLSDSKVISYYMTWASTRTSWREYKLVEGPRYSKYTGTWVYENKSKD